MYVSIDQTIAFAKTIVKTADTMDTNVWKDWIYTGALVHLGVSDDEIDVAEIKVKNFLAPLPPNLRRVLEISLFDASGNQLRHKFRAGRQRIYTDTRQSRTATGTENTQYSSVPVDVSNDKYNLVFGTNGASVDKVLIRYFKYPVDEKEQPLIREEDQYACALFVKLMQAMRDNGNRSEIAQYDGMWKQAADKAKADKRTESVTPEIAKTVINDWMRLIPKFNMTEF